MPTGPRSAGDKAPPAAAPQVRRASTLRISGPLAFPWITHASPMAVRAQALAAFARTAVPTAERPLARLVGSLPAVKGMLMDYPGLHDELSAYLPNIPLAPDRLLAKARREFAVYARTKGLGATLLAANEAEFLKALLEVHRRLGVGANMFRTRSVATAPDEAGNRIVFPDHRQCLSMLRDLHGFLVANATSPPLCAAAAYVAINRAHPFTDGNGRTARTVYNLVMAAGGSQHFLPIHSFNALSRGALTIKMQRARNGGGWEPLMAYFGDAFRLSHRLQSASDTDGDALLHPSNSP